MRGKLQNLIEVALRERFDPNSSACRDRRKLGAPGWVLRHPPPEDEHRALHALRGKGREYMKSRLAAVASVINVNGMRLQKPSGGADPPPDSRVAPGSKRLGEVQRGRRCRRIDRLLRLQLFAGAPGLPVTERHGESDARQRGYRRNPPPQESGHCPRSRVALTDKPTIASIVRRSGCLKILIAIAFVLIIASLGSALVFLIRDKGKTHNTVKALAVRVGFSVALFIFILIAHQLGWIQSTGVPVMAR